jgi:hypothetical protein
MFPALALSLLFLAGDPSDDPWIEVHLSIARDPYTSSDQVTLCRVRAVNHGGRRWPGRALAFSLPGRHDILEVSPIAPGDSEARERRPGRPSSGSKKRKRPRS